MIDLENMVQASLKELFESGKMTEIINKHTETLVNDVVRSALATYSDFGKQLTIALTESLKIDVSHVGLPEYNHTVLEIVRRRIEHEIEEKGRKQLETDLSKMLSHAVPAEIALTKFIEDFKEWAREDRFIEDYEEGYVTAFFDEPRGATSRWLYLDKNEKTEKFRCEFALLIRADGTLATVMFHGKDKDKMLFLGKIHGFERDLFHMHVAQTRIVIDDDEINTHIHNKHD